MAEISGRVGWRNYVSPVPTIWNNLKAYFTADNTANDSKGAYNGTLVNGATYSTGKINNGFSLDGINDYVNISPLGSSFSSPTSAHSYNAWIYPTSLAGYNWIIQNGLNNSGTSMILNGANLCFFIQGGNNQTTSSATLTLNTWTMVTVVYNGAGSVSFYKNGVLSNSSAASWTESVAGSNTYIGAYVGAAHFFDGKIDEVGAWSRALTAADVTELYNAGAGKQYVAPTTTSIITTGLVLNLDAGNAASYPGTGTTWTDLSGNGNNGTLMNGTAYSSANGGTLVFDGINDYVNISDSTYLDLPNTTTMEFWVNSNQLNNDDIISHRWNCYGAAYNPTYASGYVAGKLSIYYAFNNGGFVAVSTTTTPIIGQWYHLVGTYDGSTMKVYLNGVLENTRSFSGNITQNDSGLAIGSYAGSPAAYAGDGKISIVRYYHKTLSATEVLQNFNALKSRYGL